MAQNRDNHDVLVHANSGCIVPDHTSWAIWLGDKWKLDLSIFERGTNLPFDLQNLTSSAVVAEEKTVMAQIEKKRKAQRKNSALYYLTGAQFGI